MMNISSTLSTVKTVLVTCLCSFLLVGQTNAFAVNKSNDSATEKRANIVFYWRMILVTVKFAHMVKQKLKRQT